LAAALAGIKAFATGELVVCIAWAEHTFDISLTVSNWQIPMSLLVCAGAKSIPDLGLTTEYLETFACCS